jgi:AhpD family alkylhydroperoxidase
MAERMKVEEVAPEVAAAMLALSQAAEGLGIEKGLLHLIKLRASQINGCAFCIVMHTREALRDGERNERLHLLNAWHETDLYSPRERAALAWTEAVTLIADSHAEDTVYQEAAAQFPGRALADLTLAIITINGWNRLAIAFRKAPAVATPKRTEGLGA